MNSRRKPARTVWVEFCTDGVPWEVILRAPKAALKRDFHKYVLVPPKERREPWPRGAAVVSTKSKRWGRDFAPHELVGFEKYGLACIRFVGEKGWHVIEPGKLWPRTALARELLRAARKGAR